MDNPSGPPPPYPGTASSGVPNASHFNTAYPPPPQPYYAPPYKDQGSSYPTQPYGPGYTHNTSVVVTQPAVTLVQTFRESPVRTRCIHCQAEVITGIHYETGTFTWVICVVLLLIGCGAGCCLIPFCMDGCKDVLHTCPNCHQMIARYSRM